MALVLGLVGSLVGLGLGAWLGYVVGKRIAQRGALVYWALNGVTVLVGLLVNVVGLVIGQFALAMLGVGLIAGGITGLKFGYGRVMGVWKVLDSVTGGYAAEHADTLKSMADRSAVPDSGRKRDVATVEEAFGRPEPPHRRRRSDDGS